MATYRTKGSCSREIYYKVENNKLKELKFIGGCAGNLQAISKLLIGQDIDYIIKNLDGIRCRNNTSCPDQLAAALIEYKETIKRQTEAADPSSGSPKQ